MGKSTAGERRYPVTEKGYLLEFLLERVKGKSRNAVKHLLSGRQVAVDGKVVTRFDWPLEPGEMVTLLPRSREEKAAAPFPILYQDRDLIAIDKPAGLLTVGHEGERQRTAYRLLSDTLRDGSREKKLFVVHRLDRDTSGAVLFARNEAMKRSLQENWDALVRERIYLAVTAGAPEREEGVVRSWLKETSTRVVYSAGPGSGGKEAVTRYRVLSRAGEYALVRVALDTGRKNQIRVHGRPGLPRGGGQKVRRRRRPHGPAGPPRRPPHPDRPAHRSAPDRGRAGAQALPAAVPRSGKMGVARRKMEKPRCKAGDNQI